ncbi:MAG: bifunctional riboflavin kinase/FAD synthetase [Xenococcaceae cyanobacterium]
MIVTDSSKQILTPTSIALGNFDGIHRGHQKVLERVFEQSNNQETGYIYPTVVSFSPHPREFFTGKKLQLLTTIEEKSQQLDKLGIQQLVLLPFDRELASLSPQQFVEKIIVRKLQAKYISVGEDFRFGFQRKGTALDLKAIASDFGVKVYINTLYKLDRSNTENLRISSSLIRQGLQAGEIEQVNFMLGRAYSLTGKVVKGQQLGRTIGFPTANLQIPPEKLLPRYGVYAVEVLLEEKINSQPIQGVMNIGCRPTVSGNIPTVEVHLLNWSGNLYDRRIRVNLQRFLRPEQKFASLEALKQQIATDCKAALATNLLSK